MDWILYRGEEKPVTEGTASFSPDYEVAKSYAGKRGYVLKLTLPYEEAIKLKFVKLPGDRVIYYVPLDIYKRAEKMPSEVPHQPVKGEQAGMLGVPGKVHVQKRAWTPGQMEFESYQKYQEAMKEKPKPSIVDYDRRYTFVELQQMCRDKGLPTSGVG
jgi:hypothetical protein